ncbi:MAG TPA: GlsB/YeaQ/YmgE family stress response membrane protein [Candidatus Limnocylindrales bacterium]|nr:GlsB/YeaQ/YmgE family stress response membrane protein [Candidatus Limnocylindrales bacterium]
MGFIAWIVVGAIAGFLAKQVMGSREGLLLMVVLGIVGGLVGGYVASAVFHRGSVDGINLESIVIATLGAIAVVFVVNLAKGGRSLRMGAR